MLVWKWLSMLSLTLSATLTRYLMVLMALILHPYKRLELSQTPLDVKFIDLRLSLFSPLTYATY